MAKQNRKRAAPRPYCRWTWTAEQRLAFYTKHDPVSGCLIWQASVTHGGYGYLSFQRRRYVAHRLAWIAKHGAIPSGMSVCHRCDERRCVNPDHLFLGSHATNMVDRRRKRQRWYSAVGDPARGLLCDGSTPDLAPIRILYRGIEFTGQAVARVVNPDAWPAPPLAVPSQPPERTGAPRGLDARRRTTRPS